MAFTTFGTVFVDNVTPVPAAFLNKLRTEQADALDATGGGTYANLTPIAFSAGSAGWSFGAGVTVASGGFLTVAVGSTLTVSGTLAVTGASSFLHILGRNKRRPRVVLGDASATIDTATADAYAIIPTPASPRTLTLSSTTTSPGAQEGERLEFIVIGDLATGLQYSFEREDNTVVAEFHGSPSTDVRPWAIFEFSGGVWKLGPNLGGTAAAGGVEPGPGAYA